MTYAIVFQDVEEEHKRREFHIQSGCSLAEDFFKDMEGRCGR